MLFRILLAGEKIKIGGFPLKTLKKLNGLKLGIFFMSIVLARAIGLGPTELRRNSCTILVSVFLGSIFSIIKHINKINICKL